MNFFSIAALVVVVVRGDALDDAKRKTEEARKQFESAMNKLRSDKVKFDEEASVYRDKASHERQAIREHQFR
jgi:hypothetical protein